MVKKYAKEQGWNNPYKAILGGASFLGSDYIGAGQDTLYLQKWDVVGTIGTHQYMQNLMAAYSEAKTVKSMYSEINCLDGKYLVKYKVDGTNKYKCIC